MTGAASPVWSPTRLTNLGANFPYELHPDGKRFALAAAKADYPRKIAPGVK